MGLPFLSASSTTLFGSVIHKIVTLTPTNSSQSDTLLVKFHSNRKILINYEKGLLFILTNICLIMFFYISFRADQQREHLEKQVMVKL